MPTTVLDSRLVIKAFFGGSLRASSLLDQPREDSAGGDRSESREHWDVENPLLADPVEKSLAGYFVGYSKHLFPISY